MYTFSFVVRNLSLYLQMINHFLFELAFNPKFIWTFQNLALYPYSPNGRYELSLSVGEQLKLEEEIAGKTGTIDGSFYLPKISTFVSFP